MDGIGAAGAHLSDIRVDLRKAIDNSQTNINYIGLAYTHIVHPLHRLIQIGRNLEVAGMAGQTAYST
jgi:hypothetical protein